MLQGHYPAVPAEPAHLPCRGVGGLPPLLRPLRVLPARSQVSLTQMLTLCQVANSRENLSSSFQKKISAKMKNLMIVELNVHVQFLLGSDSMDRIRDFLPSFVDPNLNRSAFIWLSWIRIHIGKADPDLAA